jgi:type IV pilus assembly protein PilB
MVPQWWSNLIAAGLINADQLVEAEAVVARLGITAENAVVRLGFLQEEELLRRKAEALGIAWIELDDRAIPSEVLERVPSSVAHENCCIPVGIEHEHLLVAMVDPLDSSLIEKLEFILILKIAPVMSSRSAIRQAIERYYDPLDHSEDCISYAPEDMYKRVEDVQASDERSPIAKLLQLILSESVRMGAVSIHIEPFADRFRVQYEIDGQLEERDSPPIRIYPKLTERIMYLAKRVSGTSTDFPEGNLVAVIEGITREWDLQTRLSEYGQSFVLSIRR